MRRTRNATHNDKSRATPTTLSQHIELSPTSSFTSIQIILSMFDRKAHEYTLTGTVHHLHAHFTDTFESNHNWQFYLVRLFSPILFSFGGFFNSLSWRLEKCCVQCSCNSNVFWRIFKEELLYFLLDLLFFFHFRVWQMRKVQRLLHKYSMKIGKYVGRACLPL